MIDNCNCIHDGKLDKIYSQSESLLAKQTRLAKYSVESQINFTQTLITELQELAEDAKAELIRINEFLETDFITEKQLSDAWDSLDLIDTIWIEELDIRVDFYRNHDCDWLLH